MLVVCESCLPTLSKLRESISGLQADLKEREKILLDFTTVATTWAKHIAHLTASGAGDRSMMATNNTTLPWTGSITTGIPTPALAREPSPNHWYSPPPAFALQSCSASSRRVEQEHSWLTAWHSSASTLVLEAVINDLRNQQSEVLKQDFISLVDRLLDTGKRLIISGPLPPPRYGDVTTSRLCQLHLWPEGYCLSKIAPSLQPETQDIHTIKTIITLRKLKPRDVFRPNRVFNIHLKSHEERTFSTNIKMAVLNVRSLLNKSFIINDLILDNNLDSILLTETWLGTNAPVLTEASPPNFNFLYFIRGGKRGGGTASVSKTTMSSNEVSFSSYTSFEHHAFVFSSPPILCITVYRPPQYSTSFISDFSELLSIIHSNYNRILITGDFNLHIDNTSDPVSREFLNLSNCLDFKQHITQPTHSRGHTLDLVINYGLSVGCVLCCGSGCVRPLLCVFNITSFNQQEAPVRTVRKRYLTSEVAANFIQILQSTPAEILPVPCDFIVDNFNNKLKSTLDSVAPLFIKTIRTKPTPPWRNHEIKQLKRYCRSAERRWRKSNLTVHYEILRQHLKTYNNAVKQARISHFKKLISDNKNNPKFLFSTIDILTNSKFNRSPKTTTNALCEDFADHFRSKISDIRSSLLLQQILTVNTPGSLLLPEETLESFALVDVLVVFVKSLIAQVSRKWPLRVWLANELPERGSVVSRSNTGLCSLIKVTYLQGKMPQRDVMTEEGGPASLSLAIKRNE
ncbi:hypothetical protein ABVT39_014107 [Epinephelus coioides]